MFGAPFWQCDHIWHESCLLNWYLYSVTMYFICSDHWVYFLAFLWSQSFTGIGIWAIICQCFHDSVLTLFVTILTYLNYMFNFFFSFLKKNAVQFQTVHLVGDLSFLLQVCFDTVTILWSYYATSILSPYCSCSSCI